MPSIREEFGRILDLRWSLARDHCASRPICALRVGPKRGKTPKSCPFKNEGIPEMLLPLELRKYDFRRLYFGQTHSYLFCSSVTILVAFSGVGRRSPIPKVAFKLD